MGREFVRDAPSAMLCTRLTINTVGLEPKVADEELGRRSLTNTLNMEARKPSRKIPKSKGLPWMDPPRQPPEQSRVAFGRPLKSR